MTDGQIFGLVMGTGMVANAITGGLNAWQQAEASERWAQASETMAQDRADAMVSVAEANKTTLITTTGMQVLAMMAQANLQHQQAIAQMTFNENADLRQHSLWQRQLENDVRAMTMTLNAQIHADNLEYHRAMTEARFAHEERMTGEGEAVTDVDPATLLG